MNPTLSLTGLIGSNPLGFLAALGCLRILDAKEPVLLSWDLTDEWRARLHFLNRAAESELRNYVTGELVSFAIRRTLSSELTFADSVPKAKKGKKAEFACDIKILREQYAQIVGTAVTAATPSNRELVDWFAAFGSELMTDKTPERKVKPTAFHMTAGQQKFLDRVQKLIGAMKKATPHRKGASRSTEDRFRETLFGPWKYIDEQNALGWDPVTENVRALSAEKSDPENVLSVQGAVFLAFHALPLFPTAVTDHRLMTTAFKDFGDDSAFTWPLWDEPLSLDSVRTALQLAELQQVSPDTDLVRGRGVTSVMRSVRGDIGGKGLAILRNAVVVTG